MPLTPDERKLAADRPSGKGFQSERPAAAQAPHPAQPRTAAVDGETFSDPDASLRAREIDQAGQATSMTTAQSEIMQGFARRLYQQRRQIEIDAAIEQAIQNGRIGILPADPILRQLVEAALEQERISAQVAGQENFFEVEGGRLRVRPVKPVTLEDLSAAAKGFAEASSLRLPGLAVQTRQLPPSS